MPDTEILTQRGARLALLRCAGCFWLTVSSLSCTVSLTVSSTAVLAREAPAPHWKTGPELERRLESRFGLSWPANPLRSALDDLSRSQNVAIFLDRRVAPDQEVRFEIQDTPLRSVLQALADHLQLGTCRIGPVLYLGPRPTAAVLSTVVGQLQERSPRLPAAVRSKLARPKPLTWPDLATPRELIRLVAEEVDLRVEGLEQIPHDLWPAAELPPLDFAQRLSLLLAGFELTFEQADARTVRLLPLPASAVLERTYAVAPQQRAALAEVAQRFPDARITSQAGFAVLAGPWEAHELLQSLLQGRRSEPPKPSGKDVVWTLKIENARVGTVAQTIAKRLDRRLEYDPSLRSKLEQLVSFEVREVTLDQLLKKALAPAGLTYRLDDKTLHILSPGAAP